MTLLLPFLIVAVVLLGGTLGVPLAAGRPLRAPWRRPTARHRSGFLARRRGAR